MNREELIQRLSGFEWTDLEVKAAREKVPKSAYETVSAFANTSGGYLVFGVSEEDGSFRIVGVLNVDKVQNDFLTSLRTREKVSYQLDTRNEILDDDGKPVLVFYVPEAPRSEKPVYINGDIRRSFVRRGGGDQRCTPDEVKRFLRNATGSQFDRSAVDRDVSRCFSAEDLRWYRARYRDRNPTAEASELDDVGFLEHWGLVVEHQGERRPTAASILLFGTGAALRSLVSRPLVDCFWFGRSFDQPEGDDRWRDRATFEDNLVRTWRGLLDWYMRRRDVPFELDPETLERKDRPEDYVSFREASINLLTHQDYEEVGKKASISFYDDRVVFRNPGTAYEAHEALLQPGDKEVRNPLIVEAFRRIGIGERAGTGLRAIYREFRRLGRVLPELVNDVAGYEFRLTLLSEELLSERQLLFQASLGVDLSEEQAEALAILCRVSTVSATELGVALGLSRRDVDEVTSSLATQVLAEQVGDERFRLAPHLRERWPLGSAGGQPGNLVTDQAGSGQTSLVGDQARPPRGERARKPPDVLTDAHRDILIACATPRSQKELMAIAGVSHRAHFREKHLRPLMEAGLLALQFPDRPTHPRQRVILTERGATLVARLSSRESEDAR